MPGEAAGVAGAAEVADARINNAYFTYASKLSRREA